MLIIGAGVPRSLSGLVSNLCVGTELSIIGAGVPRSSSRHVRILNVGTELSIIGAGVPRSLSWQNLSCLVKKQFGKREAVCISFALLSCHFLDY